MRAYSGRQLIEDGIITDETCDWEDEDGDNEETDDRESILSMQSFSTLYRAFPNVMADALSSAIPKTDCTSSIFLGIFDTQTAIPVTQDGGVLKQILIGGNGPAVTSKDFVSYHYTCYVDGNEQPFSTSYAQKAPLRYRVGTGIGNCLPCEGVGIALLSMRSEETALILTSPQYGYGKLGVQKMKLEISIPKNAWLLWKVEVIKVEAATECEDLFLLASAEDRHNVPFEKLYNVAAEEKIRGTAFYHKNNFIAARQCYRRALRLMQESIPRQSTDETQMLELSQKLLQNLAQTSLKLKKNIDCCSYADQILEIDGKNLVALRKKASALTSLGQYKEAHECLVRCEKLCDAGDSKNLEAIKQERRRWREESERGRKKSRDLERLMARGVFSSNPQSSTSEKNQRESGERNVMDSSSNLQADVSVDFNNAITSELDKLLSHDCSEDNLTFELQDLSSAELSHIEHEAALRGLVSSTVDAEADRKVLIVQRSRQLRK